MSGGPVVAPAGTDRAARWPFRWPRRAGTAFARSLTPRLVGLDDAGREHPGRSGRDDVLDESEVRLRPWFDDETWPPSSLTTQIWQAVDAFPHDERRLAAALSALGAREVESLTRVNRHLSAVMVQLWDQGWTPEDVVRVVGARLSPRHAAAVTVAFDDAVDRLLSTAGPVDRRWTASVAAARGVLDGVLGGRPHLLHHVEALALLSRLGPLPEVCRPPGLAPVEPRRMVAAPGPRPELERARALLASAERAGSLDESQRLTDTAHEVLFAASLRRELEAPTGPIEARRVWLTLPDPDAKAGLVVGLAAAHRCRGVRMTDIDAVMIHGAPADLDAVELLVHSTIRQIGAAIARSSHGTDHGRRARGARDGLVHAAAHRCVLRLTAGSVAAVQRAIEDGGRELPRRLAAHDRAVDAASREVIRPASSRRSPDALVGRAG